MDITYTISRRRDANALPSELLAYIFNYATHSSDNSPNLCMLVPLLLSQVCSRWRHVGLSTAELWTTLSLQSALNQQSLSRISLFLERSGSRPLDLFLDFRDPSWKWNEDNHIFSSGDMIDILKKFLPHTQRWRSVTLLTDTWAPIHTFLSQTSSVTFAPMLSELYLFRCNEYFVREGQEFLPVALKEPVALFGGRLVSLRHVTLAGVHVNWSTSSLRNLKTLALKYHALEVTPSLEELLVILRSCQMLERLSLLGWMTRKTPGRDRLPHSLQDHLVVLSCLKQLEIGFSDVEHAIRVMEFISFTSLEELSLQDVAASLYLRGPVCCDVLLDHLASRNDVRPIRTLCLRQIQANETPIINFLSSIPHLAYLTLDKMADMTNDTVLRVLRSLPVGASTGASGISALTCPELTQLHCKGVNVPLVMECILRRPRLSTPDTPVLRTVIIDSCGSSLGENISDTVYDAFTIMGIKLLVVEEDEGEDSSSRRGSYASINSFNVDEEL